MRSEGSIVFHVGGVPTAAWVLNKVLEDSRGVLAARGVDVLLPGDVHATINRSEPRTVDVPKLAALVDVGLGNAGTHTVVASTELFLGAPIRVPSDGLFPDSGPLLETLAAATEGCRRVIVLSTCPQAHLVELLFKRMVRTGVWTPFPEWVGALDFDHMSWMPLRRRLEARFGSNAVHVIPFHSSVGGHANFVAQVANLVDRELAGELVGAPAAGVELSQKGLDLGVAASPYLQSRPDRERMREFLMRNFHARAYSALKLLDEEQRQVLAERYGDEFEGDAQ